MPNEEGKIPPEAAVQLYHRDDLLSVGRWD
jgi:hypothetical protein